MNIPIIVVAYNRTAALKRLLNNLSQAYYDDDDVELIISIDKSSNNEVYRIADEFKWEYGEKKVYKHEKNLGLKKHIMKCGDIALENDAVIMLEDDLFLSKSFYRYAKQSVKFYKDDESIAGISLYTYRVTEFSDLRPFIPSQDDSDTYFVQVPSSWGEIWTKEQWEKFKLWYENSEYANKDFTGIVPDSVLAWKESSWKKYFHMYIASKNKFIVYPKVALSTNMGNAGTHNVVTSNEHQAIIMGDFDRPYIFKKLSDSNSKYDAYFESMGLQTFLESKGNTDNLIIDYYGLKEKYIQSGYLLSTNQLDYALIEKWELALVPYELNVINNIKGDGLYLYDLSRRGNKTKNFENVSLIKYEIPSITKEKAAQVFFWEYIAAVKRKLKKWYGIRKRS